MEDPSEQQLAHTFPKSSEEFDRAEVIPMMVRPNLVKWIDDMIVRYVYLNHPNQEQLLYYTTIMASSWAKTNRLFKIQLAINLQGMEPADVLPGNFFYDILLRAHQLWTALTRQFASIFMGLNLFYNYEFILELPRSAPVAIGTQIINLISTNEHLLGIMQQLEANADTILHHIQDYQASQLLY